jgi:hypothetical protein
VIQVEGLGKRYRIGQPRQHNALSQVIGLGKMGDIARAGRTIVLVSHQLNRIRRLCHRVVWIDDGQVRKEGNSQEIVSAYESAMVRGDDNRVQSERAANTKGRFLKWEITDQRGEEPHTLTKLGPVTVKFTLGRRRPVRKGHHGIALFNHERQLIWGQATDGLDLRMESTSFAIRFRCCLCVRVRMRGSKAFDMWD